MDELQKLANLEILGLRLGDMSASLGFIVGAMILGKIGEAIVRFGGQKAPAGSIRHAVVDALVRPVGWVIYTIGIWAAVSVFPLPRIKDAEGELLIDVGFFLDKMFLAASVALLIWFGVRLVDRMADIWWTHAQKTDTAFDDQLVPVVRKSGKVFFVVVGAVMIVQNLGYSVTSLVAGLGLGGAALALASKDTVANLFGSIVIFVDRPFQIGDWVEIGEVEGTVEEVGLRVTRIRTFSNSLITVPNSQLTTTAIENWSRMKKRRIKMNIGVTYDATPEQLQAGRDAIREIISGDERFHQDFYLVNFNAFGGSSLDYFIYCFTKTTRWAEHMEVREEFLLAIMRKFSELELSFAFPSQSVYVESVPEGLLGGKSMARDLPR